MYTSIIYGSITDQEFPKVFKELTLLTGTILKDFNYCREESIFISQDSKLLLVRDLLKDNYYIQKMNPPEPWTEHEPNVLSFSKSIIKGNTFGLLGDMGFKKDVTLKKVGYSFIFNGIDILLLRVIKEEQIYGNLWLVLVKSPEYTSDSLKYKSLIKSVQSLLQSIVEDLGSVDHSFLRNQCRKMGKFGDFQREEEHLKEKVIKVQEVVIPRKTKEISQEAWDKTMEKAFQMQMQVLKENTLEIRDKVESTEKNGDILKYLKDLSVKNQKLISNTKESLALFQESLKIQETLRLETLKKEKIEKEKKEKEKIEERNKILKAETKESKVESQAPETLVPSQKLQVHAPTVELQSQTLQTQTLVNSGKDASQISSHSIGFHSVSGKVVSASAYKDAEKCLQVIATVKSSKQSMNSPSIFKGKMTIRTRCGQFMNLQSKVIEIAKHLSSLLEQGKNESEAVYKYLMYLVAKQVVKQAQTEIAVKKDLAFPMAVFCCMLMEKHVDFKEYLIGKMITKCPYIVPMYIKKGDSSDAEYRKNLGYLKKEEGSYETEIQYEERMCGVLCLYAAIVQTTALPHSYGIEYGWKWFSRILNLPVRRITAALILTFIETAGYEMYKKYPTQMPKLVKLLSEEVIPKMPAASVASVTRLQLFLEDTVTKSGTIPVPFGKYLKKK